MKRLNLGCGTDTKQSWINLDVIALPGVDVVWDLNRVPYPFENEFFDIIYCKDILEHVDFIEVLRELHRITKYGGEIQIQVPHFSSINNYLDPTHKNRFSIDTFDFFLKEHNRNYYFDFYFSTTKSKKITFLYFYRLFSPIINSSSFLQKIYERFALCNFIPANNIQITIIK